MKIGIIGLGYVGLPLAIAFANHFNVVGFDIVELCPNSDEKSSDFLAAKLYYKMLSYKFLPEIEEEEEDQNFNSPFNKLSKFKDHD